MRRQETNNIFINNPGDAVDSRVIRIGEQFVQTRTFLAGVVGTVLPVPGSTVLVDPDGQLGTFPSSRRFKQDIRDMDSASSALMHLRPVTFRYQESVCRWGASPCNTA